MKVVLGAFCIILGFVAQAIWFGYLYAFGLGWLLAAFIVPPVAMWPLALVYMFAVMIVEGTEN